MTKDGGFVSLKTSLEMRWIFWFGFPPSFAIYASKGGLSLRRGNDRERTRYAKVAGMTDCRLLTRLLYSYAFGEVAGHIDVGS
jgi:hypothetical protein